MVDLGILTLARLDVMDEELLIAFSFGRVAWMVEKARATVPQSVQGLRPLIWCVENIVRWWVWEHTERGPSDITTFPGETALPQVLFPTAIWLGTREYTGVTWRRDQAQQQDRRF